MQLQLTWLQFDELRTEIDTVARMRPFGSGETALIDGYKISWDEKGVTLIIPEKPTSEKGGVKHATFKLHNPN